MARSTVTVAGGWARRWGWIWLLCCGVGARCALAQTNASGQAKTGSTAALPASAARAAAVSPGLPAVAFDGRNWQAQLVAIAADGTVELSVEGQVVRLAPGELLTWGAPRETAGRPHLLGANQSLWVGDIIAADTEQVRLTSTSLGEVTLPVELVSGVAWSVPSFPAARDEAFARVSQGTAARDRLWLENGDVLEGDLVALADGSLGWRGAAGETTVPQSAVSALAYRLDRVGPPTRTAPRWLVGLADGSLLACQQVVCDRAGWQLALTDTIGWPTPASAVIFVQALSGRGRYLSDREQAGYRFLPYLQGNHTLARDRWPGGRVLRAGGRPYAKGLGSHSAARVTYRVEPGEGRLLAQLAIDDSVGHQGSVVFRVFLDNTVAFTSPVVRGGDAPLPMSVDVGAASSISLVVDYADHADQGDLALWLDARLVPPVAR